MDVWGTIIGITGWVIGVITTIAISTWNAYINWKSEEKKQKLQFEHSKLQMTFEDKKASCIRIINALNKAVQIIRHKNPHCDEEWKPINKNKFEESSEVLTNEIFFIGENVDQAIKLFLEIMGETVFWDYKVENKMIRRAYNELEYLAEHITISLRSEIFITKEISLLLQKVSLLKLCRFISESRFERLNFPNQSIIKLNGEQSPVDLIECAENNLALFKSELTDFLNFLKTNPLKLRNTECFMSDIARIEKKVGNI